MESNKKKLIDIFKKNVQGKKCDTKNFNPKHDGKKGHWLEHQFGISANGNNKPDILGYELKNETSSKVTFGDWSANRYIFRDTISYGSHSENYSEYFKGSTKAEKQDSFCEMFGQPNLKKNGRFSWSGKPAPKIDQYNSFGQKLIVESNLDIKAIYSFSKDLRKNKSTIVAKELQKENLIIAVWFGVKSPSKKRTDKCLKSKLEDKFNDKGWFTCKTNSDGVYSEICFGPPFKYDDWIALVKSGIVYFDSGMYQGNSRPYSQWRADKSFWDSLITERYK